MHLRKKLEMKNMEAENGSHNCLELYICRRSVSDGVVDDEDSSIDHTVVCIHSLIDTHKTLTGPEMSLETLREDDDNV
ncbi:hypothetical protein ElyMa_006508700 [Elysia marginata]|uniref:Uncharacterized protein n=1 Tax=Elysia marginata TaxID=1093978 RepID=A0AAV4I388_9GAST|nr:hypothetical protein ElyMa_006508700 [Elysia marginata]